MKWIEVTVRLKHDYTEMVESVLLQSDITGWRVNDPAQMQAFLEQIPNEWDYIDESLFAHIPDFVEIIFYVSDTPDGENQLSELIADISSLFSDNMPNLPDFIQEHVDDSSWENNWKEFFKPIEVNQKLVIKPQWEDYNGTCDIIVNLDPGYVFGTGQHESTYLCLEALSEYINPQDELLDIGCGSGILSLAGLALGASACIAVDINPDAYDVVYRNVSLNDITDEILDVYIGDILVETSVQSKVFSKKYDCVVANIVADVIIELAPLIRNSGCLKQDGKFIVSGIISMRKDEVLDALAGAGFLIEQVNAKNDWVCIISVLQ